MKTITLLQLAIVTTLLCFLLSKLFIFLAWVALPATVIYLIVKPLITKLWHTETQN